MRVLILGDCHGHLDIVHRACVDAIARWSIGAVIQVGDFGLFPKVLANFLYTGPRGFPLPVHVIDGNHEDHEWLHATREAFAKQWSDANLFVHRRAQVLELEGTRFGLLGGALHADRHQQWANRLAVRTPASGVRPRVPRHPTWANWVTDRDAERAVSAFGNGAIDVMVTHSCPAGIGVGMVGAHHLIEDAEQYITRAGHWSGPFHDCGEGGLTRLWRKVAPAPPLWLFGHFHALRENTVDGTRFVCVGSTDDSDGVPGVRPVLFDTLTRTLEVHADLRVGLPRLG